MNRFFARRKHRKSRGVAVIFTLGILGLLTVMALGFASTALLNRKVAENSSVQTYARNIAKNVALPRALFALRKGVPYGKIHSSDTNTDQDFLWKLDTLLDSKRGPVIYYSTAIGSTTYTTAAKWQYIHAPEKLKDSDPKEPIIGRFAYVAFPDYGHMDPSVNLGSVDADKRYGSTEKELSLPIGSTNWNDQLKGKLENSNRWQSFNEIFSFLDLSKDGTNDSRSMYQDGIGMNLSPASETFWVDLNKDGKQTRDEMFLRFNMTRDWTSTTVDQLIGESAEPLTLANAGAAQSNTFIPWLKYANFSSDSDINTRMKKQIAANIIQYNLPDTAETISDSEDWQNSAPTYAGIGRHPMLNELGFLVRVKTNLQAEPDNAETPTKYTYTLTYYVVIDSGAELIYPFGKAAGSGLSDSTVDITGHVELGLVGFIKQEGTGSSETDMSKIVKDYTLKSNSDKLIATGDDAADISVDQANFQMTFSGSDAWNQTFGDYFSSDPVGSYTTRQKFWKFDTNNSYASGGTSAKEITFTFTINSGTNYSDQIKDKICVKSVVLRPGKAILTYGGKKRDFASLNDLEIFSGTQKVFDSEYVFSSCYEAKDPLVNHYPSDWTSPSSSGTPTHYVGTYNASNFSDKNYPGTISKAKKILFWDYYGEGHLNSTIPAKMLDETINQTKIQETATNPAYTYKSSTITRLSTSYIRHGQMKSLWELAFISRAEAFRTLNLAKTKIFEPSVIDDLKAGDFADGDANILDQVKFSDTTSDDQLYKYGKISLNSRAHKVFSQLFKNGVNWYEALRASAVSDQFSSTPTGSSDVCTDTNCQKMTPCNLKEAVCSHPSCLAHLLLDRCSILPFFNRSDLLLDPDDANFSKLPGYSALSSDAKDNLKTAQTNLRNFLLKTSDTTILCKAEKEQYAARFMHLFSTEQVNRVYIIIVAQTIKDIGGVPAFADWDCNGEFAPTGEIAFPDSSAKGLKSGYVRRKLDGSGYELVGGKTQAKETFLPTDTTIGTYDHGADKITGEAKLIVEMQKDVFTNKWRIAGYRYVE